MSVSLSFSLCVWVFSSNLVLPRLSVVQTVQYEEGSAEDETLREMVELAVQRLYDALNPAI